MLTQILRSLVALTLILAFSSTSHAQVTPDKIVVSYPSKSITNFPIFETAQRRGFFQKENLAVSMVYMRGGIDIKALITGDADFGTGSTTAVTAFVAGAPLRVVMSMNAFVDQALYAQHEVSKPGTAQRPVHRLAQPWRSSRHAAAQNHRQGRLLAGA